MIINILLINQERDVVELGFFLSLKVQYFLREIKKKKNIRQCNKESALLTRN